ncbi:Sec20-domain-containing protein [Hygrophoropsis aurantiaca]|uniref:Sec20-domain-containing protein n=1 Tax=Hygrophoropsis aurantiaca TaxID=72124 RepID=A0ACB8AAG8_9AGAM|nr:Sec20-domain-containing protein [Hygrophoropsis aurantiaca]
MPPLPTLLDSEALDLISNIERRQNDLVSFQIARLRACEGPLSVQQTLAAELREDTELLARYIEDLDVLVDDQRSERSRRELRERVDTFRESLSSIKRDSRAALLASKRSIDLQSRSQREELLRSSVLREAKTSNEKVTDDILMKANDNVTDSLQRTIGLMQKELERSVLSTQLLESSTASLRSTSTTHDTLTNVMGTSKQLITALEKTDWMDRLVIISALVFFALVVVFILQQRIVNRGLRIAFWWTRFLPSASSSDRVVLDMLEKGDVSTVLASISASAATAFSTLATTITNRGDDGRHSDIGTSESEALLSDIPDTSRTIAPVDTMSANDNRDEL